MPVGAGGCGPGGAPHTAGIREALVEHCSLGGTFPHPAMPALHKAQTYSHLGLGGRVGSKELEKSEDTTDSAPVHHVMVPQNQSLWERDALAWIPASLPSRRVASDVSAAPVHAHEAVPSSVLFQTLRLHLGRDSLALSLRGSAKLQKAW